MAMSPLKQTRKNYKDLFRRSDARWKKLLFPYPIEPEAQTADEVKWRRTYNRVVWGILGLIWLTSEVVVFPHIGKMLLVIALTLILLVTLSSLLQNFQVKKSPAGRKSPAPIASFADCFTDKVFLDKVDDFIVNTHDEKQPMDSPEGQELLNFILKHGQYLRPRLSFHRLSALLIKDYYPQGVLSFNTPDALRLAKPNQADKQRVEWFFEDTSK